MGAREAGPSLKSIAAILTTNAPFQQIYPSFLTAQEFSDRLVMNMLPTSTPTAARLWSANWIAGKLSAGASKAAVLLGAAQALMATSNPNYADAQKLMLNRIDVSINHAFAKPTITAGTLNLALAAAATSGDGDYLVFVFAGNTYVYADDAGGSANNQLDDNDLLLKLVGTLNLDLLVDALS